MCLAEVKCYSKRLRLRTLLAISIYSLNAFGQQYPPGQYPPGQYPPGQYPPGQYPGGTGGGLQLPQMRLPKRKPKEEKTAKIEKVAVKQIVGTLRKLTEKELLLALEDTSVRKFRLLAKSTFHDKEGAAMRDSLLKVGDHLTVEVSPDDEETALRIQFVRSPTAAEKAEEKVENRVEAVDTPAKEASSNPARAPLPDEAPPKIQRRPQGGQSQPYKGEPDDAPAPAAALLDPVIEDARAAAQTFSATLPNYLVQQHTTRYFSNTRPAKWQAVDVVSADVVSQGGKEEYRNITINGKVSKKPIEETGAWSTGEFTQTLQDILSPATAAVFVKRSEQRIANRQALVYGYTVKQTNSHWSIHAPDKRTYRPAYKGSLWIDKETHRVMRIEQQTLTMPEDFPFDKTEATLDYDFVRIGTQSFLLPAHGENLICQRGTSQCSRNSIDFRNYRKFGAESNIQVVK